MKDGMKKVNMIEFFGEMNYTVTGNCLETVKKE